MRCYGRLSFLVTALSCITGALAGCEPRQKGLSNPVCHTHDELLRQLSANASISSDAGTAPRWSAFHAVTPGAVVHVATAQDVQTTVRQPYRIPSFIPKQLTLAS